ncbi:DUF3626 domain-containing protein [Spiroplasma ixodetis]|uniref:DUF3626 domain-containing protein n=1 Tax=Spiroplasma ixodetis TaxID=2141 RepID=UPI00257912F8|nr:DUF3626 domain-containing protein [Spiroplasma ixodetis]WJG70572.1 hypothetical protein SIXOD_v1c17630 [Spiroplasma ixodetis Y32]
MPYIKQSDLSHINGGFPSTSSNNSKDEERLKKEIYGQLFRSEILHQIYELCESSQQEDYKSALKILSKKCKMSQENAKDLLEKITKILQSSRLTINFDFSKIYDINNKWPEVLNCFAYKEKPNEISNYNVGRASIEEVAFYLNQLFDNSKYEKFGRFSTPTGDQTKRSANFQWTSRPCYAALDFLENPMGGAPMYGKSFIVLKDYVKHNCTYSPYDTYSPPTFSGGKLKDKISTFLHFSRLIRYCQNDLFGYNCLESLINKANGKDFVPHRNYGKSEGNYIEAHIYSRILFARDIKQICLSKAEFDSHTPNRQKQILEKINEINSCLGSSFIIFITQEEYKIKQEERHLEDKLSLKQEKITKLKSDIVKLEKKKINPILNFIIKVFSFGCINKNKEIKKIINAKNIEIKNLLLDIKNNETPHSPLISTETMPLLQDRKVTDEKKFDKQSANDEELNNPFLNSCSNSQQNLL